MAWKYRYNMITNSNTYHETSFVIDEITNRHNHSKNFINNDIEQKLGEILLITNADTVTDPSIYHSLHLDLRTVMIEFEYTSLATSTMMSMIWFELFALSNINVNPEKPTCNTYNLMHLDPFLQFV